MKCCITYANNNLGRCPLRGGEINLTFRSNFDSSEISEWEELERELEGVQLNPPWSVYCLFTVHIVFFSSC
jgi:hypothetical protein